MDGLTLGMRGAVVLMAVLGLAVPCDPSEPVSPDHYAKAVVIWQAEEPTCFEPNQTLRDQMATMPRPEPAGEVAPPKKIDGPPIPKDFFEGINIHPAIPVMEVVINPQGNVESVVALRPTTPDFDQRIAEYLREWTFEPSTLAGEPICSTYVLVLHICWQ